MIITLATILSCEMALINPVIAPVDYAHNAEQMMKQMKEDYNDIYWYSYAKKEVEGSFKIEVYNHTGHENYEYLVESGDRIFKLDSNEVSSFVNRNTKFTAVIAEDEMLLSWNGNNMISVEITDDPNDSNEYEFLIFEGTVIR